MTAAPALEVRRAKHAVTLVFFGSGFGFASWASRIPQVRSELDLSPAALGILLLAIAPGSLIALPSAGAVVHRFGAARTIVVTSLVASFGLILAGLGVLIGVAPVAVGLVFIGLGVGIWDVAMNVEGAEVERRLARSIMSRFHAGFSLGTVAGAVGGAAMNALSVSVTVHLVGVAIVLGIAMPLATRNFLPAGNEDEHGDGARVSVLRAWREPRTLLIGVFVLTMAFSEGTGNDWIAVASIDGHGASSALGSLAFGLFVAAMTAGRWFGASLLDRFGRVATMRASALVAFVGLMLFVFGPAPAVNALGIALWGLGSSLGFPTGMSAAADDPRMAAARVSVVATIGYVSFLAGPTAVGLIGEQTGTLRALIVTAGLLGIGALVAGATRPLQAAEHR